MKSLLWLIMLSTAQAHLTYLLVDSQISQFRHKLKLPNFLRDLTNCPVCLGFWISLFLSILVFRTPSKVFIFTLSIGYLGSLLYEFKQKFLPCDKCQNRI